MLNFVLFGHCSFIVSEDVASHFTNAIQIVFFNLLINQLTPADRVIVCIETMAKLAL